MPYRRATNVRLSEQDLPCRIRGWVLRDTIVHEFRLIIGIRNKHDRSGANSSCSGLDVNQVKLSEWASISAATLKRIESSSEIHGAADTIRKIQLALEAAGVESFRRKRGWGAWAST